MRTLIAAILLFGGLYTAQAQLYVLQDHRPDSMENVPYAFDTLSTLCDSLAVQLKRDETVKWKKYVPDFKYLKSTYDTLNVEYDDQKVIFRRQLMLEGLRRDFRKIEKHNEKERIRFRSFDLEKVEYDYGRDEYGNQYCYVSMIFKKRSKEYTLKFVALELRGQWFVADEMTFMRSN